MPTAQRDVIEFPNGVPVTVSLKYSEPKRVSARSGERFLYSLTDGRVMFLDPEPAAQTAQLGINVRESVSITRLRLNGADTWQISRAAGEQPNGTFVVPAAPPAPAATNGTAPATKPMARATTLVDEANALVAAYASVLDHALNTYQGRVKPDEVRSLLISAYIQRAKLSAA
jgi:hypothetical protein